MFNPSSLIVYIENTSYILDRLIPIIFVIALSSVVIFHLWNAFQKNGPGKGTYLGTWLLLEASLLVAFIFILPDFLAKFLPNLPDAVASIRWFIIYVTIIPYWYRITHENSGRRGVLSVFIILSICLLGWWSYDRWVGILFVSIPILLILMYATFKVAQIILPSSDSDSAIETRKKTRAFIMYMLGLQHPVWVARDKIGHNYETRVAGDNANQIGHPGIIWTWSHQVAGLSKGVEFNRVAGPGIIFTGQFESPVALVDLRTQLRVRTVNTVTKDGMEVPVVVYAAFAIDKQTWPREGWSKAFYSKLKYHIGKDFGIDHPEGSYPYSSARVRSVLSTLGVGNPLAYQKEKPKFFWDEWVVNQIEHATRQIVTGRSLDELWRPLRDGPSVSALEEIAADLKDLLIPKLAEVGVELFTVRIVNYELDENSHIVTQNLNTWSSYWDQRITEANADIEIIYREEIEKAHAYSKSILLSAIADSIAKARQIHEDLPKHVIAQYFVHALEEYIKKQPGLNIAESKQKIENLKEFLIYNRTEGIE